MYENTQTPLQQHDDAVLTSLIGRAFEKFSADRKLDADDPDWPAADAQAWADEVERITAEFAATRK